LKKRLTIGVIVTAMAATMSFVVAGPSTRERARTAALSPNEIVGAVQTMGLVPTTQAFRHGHFYILHALDRRGTELRVVADAAFGDIVSVTPLYVPRYDAGPRIIHVPQPGERRGSIGESDEAALPDDEIIEQVPRTDAPSAPPRRSVRSVSPPPPANDLSPIYPTPKFKVEDDAQHEIKSDPVTGMQSQANDAKNDAEKFRAPDRQADRMRLPPPSYTPPPPAQD
jgi:hypothetical protein